MAIVKAKNTNDAEALLDSGASKVELAYDIGSDDFFRLASRWCKKGAKISRRKKNFIVSVEGFSVPPND